jgi:hypothetical protein
MTRPGLAGAPGKVLLIRVGADGTEGGGQWNGPIDTGSGRFAYVPIPESKPVRPGFGRPYSELVPTLKEFECALPSHLSPRLMHLDPDFEFLSYGDRGSKGRQLVGLQSGDLVVFYAGLRATALAGNLVYAIIGALTVDRVRAASDRPQEQWHVNAHSRREPRPDGDDMIVFGQPQASGRLRRAVVVGEYRNRAYRVTTALLDEWGGLSANDGYLQRSAVFPRCLEPARFMKWWAAQGAELVAENNPLL